MPEDLEKYSDIALNLVITKGRILIYKYFLHSLIIHNKFQIVYDTWDL